MLSAGLWRRGTRRFTARRHCKLFDCATNSHALHGGMRRRGCAACMACIPIAVLLATPLVWCNGLLPETGKVIDFVDVLKHDLRKNNDDYIEPLLSNATAANISQPGDPHDKVARRSYHQKNSIATPENLDTTKNNKRRSFNEIGSSSKEDLATDDEIQPAVAPDLTEVPMLAAPMIPTVPKTATQHHETTTTPPETTRTTVAVFTRTVSEQQTAERLHFRSHKKKTDKGKVDRFKQFMKKNKGIFNDFVSKKAEANTLAPPQSRAPPPASTAPPATPPAPSTPPPAMPAPPPTPPAQPKARTAGPLLAAFLRTMRTLRTMKTTSSSPAESAGALSDETLRLLRQRVHRVQQKVTPNGEAMDMVPAKGSKIHELRIKGRLCQRNVMLPEGPKYDSKGKMYLGAYTHMSGRDYSKTRRPQLLLPRCCNCCKKSVLGCE